MDKAREIHYIFKSQLEFNNAFMPFIINSGIFIKQNEKINLGEMVELHLVFSWANEELVTQGKVIWWTPLHALHHAVAGIGIQLFGENISIIKRKLESLLDTTNDIAAYTSLRSDNFKASS